MRFANFLQIHFWNAFHELCSPFHQDEESDTELFLRTVFFILRYLLEWCGKKKRIVSRGNWLVFNNQENGFPYFIYVLAIIFI